MDNQLKSNVVTVFKNKFYCNCHSSVIEGYNLMLKNPKDFNEWEEENITARLCKEIKNLPFIRELQISITREYYLDDEEILEGVRKAKEANRIDFRFSKWHSSQEIDYFGEAKNLSHRDWTKKNDKNVNASQQQSYYIQSGIQKLVTGEYKDLNGFLIGYIVNGQTSDIVQILNKKIIKKRLNPQIGEISNQQTICGHPDCYTSINFRQENNSFILRHIFLKF